MKLSSGAIICDIGDYDILQKLLGNFDPEYEVNAHLTDDYRSEHDDDIDADALVGQGVPIQHNTLAGIFSQYHNLPVGMFSGSAGHAFQRTLSLNDPKMCMSSDVSHDTGFSYTLYDCNLQVEVVQLPESVFQKLNAQLMEREKVYIPVDKSYIPDMSRALEIAGVAVEGQEDGVVRRRPHLRMCCKPLYPPHEVLLGRHVCIRLERCGGPTGACPHDSSLLLRVAPLPLKNPCEFQILPSCVAA
jgi:hypothetical protein